MTVLWLVGWTVPLGEKKKQLSVSDCPPHHERRQMCCRCAEMIQLWVPQVDKNQTKTRRRDLLLLWSAVLVQWEMRISRWAVVLPAGSGPLIWLLVWKRGRSCHQTGTFKSALNNFQRQNARAVQALMTLLTALHWEDAANASVSQTRSNLCSKTRFLLLPTCTLTAASATFLPCCQCEWGG